MRNSIDLKGVRFVRSRNWHSFLPITMQLPWYVHHNYKAASSLIVGFLHDAATAFLSMENLKWLDMRRDCWGSKWAVRSVFSPILPPKAHFAAQKMRTVCLRNINKVIHKFSTKFVILVRIAVPRSFGSDRLAFLVATSHHQTNQHHATFKVEAW